MCIKPIKFLYTYAGPHMHSMICNFKEIKIESCQIRVIRIERHTAEKDWSFGFIVGISIVMKLSSTVYGKKVDRDHANLGCQSMLTKRK